MRLLLSGGLIFKDDKFTRSDVLIEDGLIISLSPLLQKCGADRILDISNKYIIPGFVDVHTHLREPGFSYKETIHTGSMAAARGGYSIIGAMPNVEPCPDTYDNLKIQLDIINKDAVINVLPYACITKGRSGRGTLSDMKDMSEYIIAYSDDGTGLQDEALMKEAMITAKECGKIIAAHCEDESLIKKGGCIHDGIFARENGFIGISSESEYKQIERDINLVRETKCSYHVCHVSAKESVELIRNAKREGLNITCETAPHYLLLCENDLIDDGRFKMNPPLRSYEDKLALIEGLIDNTIDIIATDHAPHSAEEKSKGLKESAMGVSGLECAFSVLYTGLVKTGVISFEKLIDKMSVVPREIFSLNGGIIAEGETADLAVLNIDTERIISGEKFLSKGKFTPFEGMKTCADVELNIYSGRVVWQKN